MGWLLSLVRGTLRSGDILKVVFGKPIRTTTLRRNKGDEGKPKLSVGGNNKLRGGERQEEQRNGEGLDDERH